MEPGTAAPSTAAGPRFDFRLLYVGAFVAYGDRFAIAPILVSVAGDLGESLAAVTVMATLYFLLYGLLQPVYGIVSDRVGRVRVMRFALCGMFLASAASAFAPNLPTLVLAKAAAAAFVAAVLPTSLVYVGDMVPLQHRQHVIANVLAAGSVGTVLATVGAGMAARYSTWRLVFLVPAVISLLLAVALGRLPESLSRTARTGALTPVRQVFSHPWAVFLVVLALAEGAFMLGFLTFLAPALEARGHSAAVAGAVTATYGVAVFVGLQGVKRIVRQASLPPSALIAGGGTLLVVAYLVAAANQQVTNVLLASVLIGVGYALLHSTLQTWATDVAPEARGTAISFFVTAVFTGAALGTAAVRGLADTGRYQELFLVAAALTVPVAVIASVARTRYPPGGGAGTP
ncbi:MAG TPA: MFS transporter [Acidimicrobiales bacterium]|nr:MFS transporter [Acidimicrobiales bacterium]